MTSELRIIEEAIKIILRDQTIDNKIEKELLVFHAKSIEEIVAKYQKEIEYLKTWKED